LIQARYEAVNAHDYDRFQSLYAPGVAWRDPATPRPVKGPRSVRKRLEAWTAAVPNLRWQLDDLFSEIDSLCAQLPFTGSHKGRREARVDRSGRPTLDKPEGEVGARNNGIQASRPSGWPIRPLFRDGIRRVWSRTSVPQTAARRPTQTRRNHGGWRLGGRALS